MKSNRIVTINFCATLLILILHGHFPIDNTEEAEHTIKWYYSVWPIMKVITDAAVPTFFGISSYLLFRNLTYKNYFNKVKSRFYSLVIPYLICSIGFLIFFNIVYLLIDGVVKTKPCEILTSIYYCKMDGPIWYLRALFYFVLCSPILLFLFSKIGNTGVFCALLLSMYINTKYVIPYDTFYFWLPVLIAFGYMGYKRPQFLFADKALLPPLF